MSLSINTHYLSTKFSINGRVTWCVLAAPSLKPERVARTVPNSHVTVFCFIPLVFQKSRVLRTVNGAAYLSHMTVMTSFRLIRRYLG